jgi:hypothetical protein
MTQMKLYAFRYKKIEDAYRNTKTHYDMFLISDENNNLKVDFSILMFMDDGKKPYVHWFETNLPKNKKFYIRHLFIQILPSGEIYYKDEKSVFVNFCIFCSHNFIFAANIVRDESLTDDMKLFIPRNQMEEIMTDKIKMSVTT